MLQGRLLSIVPQVCRDANLYSNEHLYENCIVINILQLLGLRIVTVKVTILGIIGLTAQTFQVKSYWEAYTILFNLQYTVQYI